MRTRNDGDEEGEEKATEGTGGEDADGDKEGRRRNIINVTVQLQVTEGKIEGGRSRGRPRNFLDN